MVNLKETGRYEELGKGTFFINLCKRLNEVMLTQYNRWHFENNHWELVETLKEFLLREAEFQTVASETIRGVNYSNKNTDSRRTRGERLFFGISQESETRKFRTCKSVQGTTWRLAM